VSMVTHDRSAIADRVTALDWQEIIDDWDNYGCGRFYGLLEALFKKTWKLNDVEEVT
jgi:hypothetical protein